MRVSGRSARSQALAVALLIPIAAGCSRAPAPGAAAPLFAVEAAPSRAPQSGANARPARITFSDKPVPVPAVHVTTLDGQTLDSSTWAGKVVLVNFWATWCGPCREEIPVLIALQDHYKDQLLVVGLSVDERPPAEVLKFVQDHKINYPVAIADAALQQAFGRISAVPATYVINKTGGMVQRHIGLISAMITEQEVRSLSGLSTSLPVEVVPDNGQVLLANAAYATEIPGIDLKVLTPEQREKVLKVLNTSNCTCGCGLTMAQCRINDPSCSVSLPAAKKLVAEIVGR